MIDGDRGDQPLYPIAVVQCHDHPLAGDLVLGQPRDEGPGASTWRKALALPVLHRSKSWSGPDRHVDRPDRPGVDHEQVLTDVDDESAKDQSRQQHLDGVATNHHLTGDVDDPAGAPTGLQRHGLVLGLFVSDLGVHARSDPPELAMEPGTERVGIRHHCKGWHSPSRGTIAA